MTDLLATYRAGPTAPLVCSLQPGELYVETQAASGSPRLWVGTPPSQGVPGNVALILTATPKPEDPSAFVIGAITNPSTNNRVRTAGTVTPGCVIEIAIIAGRSIDHFMQVTPWMTVNASAGSFNVTQPCPAAQNVRARVRMRDDPGVFLDSNIFVVTGAPPQWPP